MNNVKMDTEESRGANEDIDAARTEQGPSDQIRGAIPDSSMDRTKAYRVLMDYYMDEFIRFTTYPGYLRDMRVALIDSRSQGKNWEEICRSTGSRLYQLRTLMEVVDGYDLWEQTQGHPEFYYTARMARSYKRGLYSRLETFADNCGFYSPEFIELLG